MKNYIEYIVDDDTTILVEIDEDMVKELEEEQGPVIKASNKANERTFKSKIKLDKAFKSAKKQAKVILDEFSSLPLDEVEIKFGLNTALEGNFAVGKVEVGANYEVTIKWKKPVEKSS